MQINFIHSQPLRIIVLITLWLTPIFATQAENATLLSKESLYQLMLADFASYNGDYPKALEYYQQQAKHLNNTDVAEKATRLAYYLKRYPEMLENAIRWQQYSNESKESLFYSAVAYANTGHFNHAYQSMLLAGNKGHPTDFTRLVSAIGNQNSILKQYQVRLSAAEQQTASSPDTFMALAQIAQFQNNRKQAIAFAQKSMNASQYQPIFVEIGIDILQNLQAKAEMQAVYKKALQKTPTDNQLRQKYALFLTTYDIKQAKNQLLILQASEAENTDYIFHLALVHLELNDVIEAKTLFEQLLAMGIKTASAHYYLALIYQYENNPSEALKHFEAIENPEEKQKISVQIARAYIEDNQLKQALKISNQALKSPTSEEQQQMLLITKASIYQLLGNIQGASSILDELSHKNDTIVNNDNDILYRKAMLYQQLGKLEHMENDLQFILKKDPDNTAALNALGFVLADQSIRLDEAFQLIQKAHKLEPEDPAVLDSLGWVLYRLGRTDEAIDFLRSAIAQYPDGEVAAHLGEVLWVSGQHHDAEEIFTEALNREPEHIKLNETIKRLAIPLQ